MATVGLVNALLQFVVQPLRNQNLGSVEETWKLLEQNHQKATIISRNFKTSLKVKHICTNQEKQTKEQQKNKQKPQTNK